MYAQSVGMFGCCVCRYVQSKIDVGECRMLAPAPTAGMPRGLPARVNNGAFFHEMLVYFCCWL